MIRGGIPMERYCKVLVVDDEVIMRQGIKHLLDWEHEGFQIVGETSNGKEALEMVENLQPNIVISDIVMPVMDGIDFTKIMQEKYPGIQIVILSSYSEFEYVKSTFQHGAVDYILKPTLSPKELIDTLKKAALKIPNMRLTSSQSISLENMVNQLLSGFDFETNCAELTKKFPHPEFLLLGMNVPYVFEQGGEILNRQRDLLQNAADSALADFTFQQVTVNGQILLLILNFEQEQYQHLKVQMKQMVEHMAKNSSDLFYVYSERFYSIGQMKTVYNDSFLKYMEQRFYNKNHKILSVSDFESVTQRGKFDFKSYSHLLNTLQFNEALKYLHDYVSLSLKQRSLGELELKALTQNALYNIISMLEELDFDLESLNCLKRDYFIKISNVKFSEDFMECLDVILSDFYAIVDKYKVKIDMNMMNKIMDYISANYAEPLTLADVAKVFSFNYYYLSSYFSAHNKEGFSEHLNKVRIEKAVDLLHEEDVPISEVCDAVGYSDHSYFCKVFKKYTGSTPSEFRKKFTL